MECSYYNGYAEKKMYFVLRKPYTNTKTRMQHLFISAMVMLLLSLPCQALQAQSFPFTFGVEKTLDDSGPGKGIAWVDVNTSDSTWTVTDEGLSSTGLPIGVIRSVEQYENFILQVDWCHLEAGGNSGIFIWCDAVPEAESRLPSGVEVQMLELDWVNQNKVNGQEPPIAYVHGELFGAGKTQTTPDNPRGIRSKSIENRCLGVGQWNSYTVVCVDGTVKLSVNGKFVNGVRLSSQRKGYLCLEAEGAKIKFRNFKLTQLPPSVLNPDHAVRPL